MRMLLLRDTLAEGWTMGALLLDGKHFCWTLEDSMREIVTDSGWLWRHDLKVPAETAIPAGTYEVSVNWSNKFKRRMPLIMAVPSFEGIRFHGGSNVDHSEGCPLMGRHRNQREGLLWDSGGLTDALTERIDSATRRGKVWCEVRNP